MPEFVWGLLAGTAWIAVGAAIRTFGLAAATGIVALLNKRSPSWRRSGQPGVVTAQVISGLSFVAAPLAALAAPIGVIVGAYDQLAGQDSMFSAGLLLGAAISCLAVPMYLFLTIFTAAMDPLQSLRR